MGFDPTLAAEMLPVSDETLRNWLLEAGLWERKRRRQKHRQRRERRECFGTQADGSERDWLEGRGLHGSGEGTSPDRRPHYRTSQRGGRYDLPALVQPVLHHQSGQRQHPPSHAFRYRVAYNGAAEFTSCYGPEDCSPCTDQGFYFRAFIP